MKNIQELQDKRTHLTEQIEILISPEARVGFRGKSDIEIHIDGIAKEDVDYLVSSVESMVTKFISTALADKETELVKVDAIIEKVEQMLLEVS